MKDYQIAILLATYNGEKYLTEQIDSILSQTCHDWHLYIHDDGSKDSQIKNEEFGLGCNREEQAIL